ncbi:MAG TPA: lipopolysaccharide assembly protein LapA domain-containing protein [Deltaproteobacteria bacterium]|nr:lipopolysaccharide assembly protein LapA domain-containing protein [Deltaproteobacteria bacterium]HOM29869.1 lipopolysaccharide assembly protein LapA domain-containing protein [Deltaproteobacteria bacterium]HPP81658.1 lipopolysaccharide assembly protein LapA domain-containing protein [Deltaproteobacteria bacterium]
MRVIKALAFVALAVIGVLFAASNQEPATVHLYSFKTLTYPLYLVLFGCLAAGTAVSILSALAASNDGKEIKALSRRRDELRERLKKSGGSGGQR